ncbi:MAG: hypothetical protein E7468_06700 [Ruminococcaceae bacterium]|nr:hypothetical protein [Oscillospiraceae bacterium]
MKKKILSLLLVMAMLLSIVPMAGAAGEAAEPKFNGYNLYLQNDIAICFEANRAAIEEGFEKVEFYIDGELVQTRTTLPEADANGNVSFRCTKLTPAQMGETVTAKLYIGGEVKHEFSTSIKDYCMTILRNESNTEAWKNAELRTMLVDMLNYGAATQTFAEATTPLVNADLGEYAALATTGNLSLTNACSLYEYTDVTAPTVTWYGVGLNLKDSVTLRYEFVAESVEGLAIHFFNDGKTLDAWVTDFEKVEGTEDHYYAYFGMLNPAQLSETVSAVAYLAYNTEDSVRTSHKLMYSAESYAYAVANGTGFSAELEALTDAMMRYGNAVRCWINGHVYVNGKCESCDKEKVFGMTTDTITIDVNKAVLNIKTNEYGAVNSASNENAKSGGIISFNKRFATTTVESATRFVYSDAKTYITQVAVDQTIVHAPATYPGNVIMYVTPAKSGTYQIEALVATKGAAAVGYLVEDESTTENTYYQYMRIAEATETGKSFAEMSKFTTVEFGDSYQWVAGKTYAIRLLATSSNIGYDQFTITHIHTYDDDADITCNGCGEERHVHTKEIAYDDTHHWYDYTCGCTDLDESKVEHTYTNGVCECGKQRVFVMDSNTIAINAEEAILNTDYVELITNSNVGDRKLVKLNNAHSAYINNAYVTTAVHPGDVIVYVTPSISGTYTVATTGVYTRANVTLTGVLVEDDTTTSETKFGPRWTPNPCSVPASFSGGSIIPMVYGTEYQWTAGKTYAIRVASGSTRIAIDQFVITCTTPAE